MSLLFLYLLENASHRVVIDSEIIKEIWIKNGLKGSAHRLWEVMANLKKKIIALGLERGFYS